MTNQAKEWKLVPVEPTEEMIVASLHHTHLGDMAGRYKAMLAAAPSHQAGQEGIVGRLNAHIDASTKPDWRELAEASDRIETLEGALRVARQWMPLKGECREPSAIEDCRIVDAALADGGG